MGGRPTSGITTRLTSHMIMLRQLFIEEIIPIVCLYVLENHYRSCDGMFVRVTATRVTATARGSAGAGRLPSPPRASQQGHQSQSVHIFTSHPAGVK